MAHKKKIRVSALKEEEDRNKVTAESLQALIQVGLTDNLVNFEKLFVFLGLCLRR